MSNKIIKKAAACGLSAVMAFGLVAVTEAPKTTDVSAATKKVQKLSFQKKGYVMKTPGRWMNVKIRLKFVPKSAKTYKLTYKSSNKKIVTISKNGILRTKKKGTVTITAIAKNNKKAIAKTKLTVGKVVKTLKFKEGKKKTVTEGKKFTLHPTYAPKSASTKAVTFKSSNKKIATVSSKGKVTAKKAGKVTITATCKDAKGKKAKFTVTVKAKPSTPSTPSQPQVVVEEVKPVVKNDTATISGLKTDAEKYVIKRKNVEVTVTAAEVKEALGYLTSPASAYKTWVETTQRAEAGNLITVTGEKNSTTKTVVVKNTNTQYDGTYLVDAKEVKAGTEYAVTATRKDNGKVHNIKVTVAANGTVTAISNKYTVTSDKDAVNVTVVNNETKKTVFTATKANGEYTITLPAGKVSGITIEQYIEK